MSWENLLRISVFLYPLTPKCDYHVTSPYKIDTLSSQLVMRIIKPIRWKLIAWSNTNFLQLIHNHILEFEEQDSQG